MQLIVHSQSHPSSAGSRLFLQINLRVHRQSKVRWQIPPLQAYCIGKSLHLHLHLCLYCACASPYSTPGTNLVATTVQNMLFCLHYSREMVPLLPAVASCPFCGSGYFACLVLPMATSSSGCAYSVPSNVAVLWS